MSEKFDIGTEIMLPITAVSYRGMKQLRRVLATITRREGFIRVAALPGGHDVTFDIEDVPVHGIVTLAEYRELPEFLRINDVKSAAEPFNPTVTVSLAALQGKEPKLEGKSLQSEAWREYVFEGRPEPYRITDPVLLYARPGGTTHRVVDGTGIVHCVPAPGQHGCILRWKPKDQRDPVQF